MNKLASKNTTAVVPGPNDKTERVSSERVVKALVRQNFTLDPQAKNYINSDSVLSSVGPRGLQAPTHLDGIYHVSSETLYQIAIAHEGLHVAYPWLGNMWVGYSRDEYFHDHQIPFNQAAQDLLR